jgi:hypothetical protein
MEAPRVSEPRKRWHAVLDRIPTGRPLVGVEVGVLTAKLAVPLLRERPLLTLYLVDLWAPPAPGSSYARTPDDHARKSAEGHERDYRLTLKRVAFAGDRARVLRVDSAAGVALAPALHFAFIDADHSREGVVRDIDACLPKIRPGGWLGGHDYGHPLFPGVRRAVDAAFGTRVELDADRTWFVRIGVG